jgi:nucleotide-binding universal stress UspA family protein
MMPGIISAIRGGPESQLTIDKAIALSKETNLPLYFFYVVNLDFLVRTETSRTHTLSQEMHEMGEFILLQAATKAGEQNVSTQKVIRHGNFKEEIIKLCLELKADYVIMGQPRSQEDRDLFTAKQISDFGRRIEDETGANVILAEARSQDEK